MKLDVISSRKLAFKGRWGLFFKKKNSLFGEEEKILTSYWRIPNVTYFHFSIGKPRYSLMASNAVGDVQILIYTNATCMF